MKTRSLLIFLSVEKDFACRDSKLSSGPRKLISLKYPSGSNFQSKILELAHRQFGQSSVRSLSRTYSTTTSWFFTNEF